MLEYLKGRLSVLEHLEKKNKLKLSELMNSKSIITLGGLSTADSQGIFMEELLRQIYSYAVSSEDEKLRTYILVDEAGKLGDNPILGRLVSEGRKYGIGIIAISQSAKTLDKDVRANSSLLLSFYTREPEELNYLSSYISGGSDGERLSKIKSSFRRLRVGEAVAIDYNTMDPLLVRFEKIKNVTEPLEFLLQEFLRKPKMKCEIERNFKEKGMKSSDIEKTLNDLEKIGKIKSFPLFANSEYDGIWYIRFAKNTPEHDITIYLIKKHLESLGIYSLIYNKAYGPDLTIEKNNIKIAVEYETGLKNFNETKDMINERLKTFDKILVLCNNSFLERYLNIQDERIKVMGINEFLKLKELHVFN